MDNTGKYKLAEEIYSDTIIITSYKGDPQAKQKKKLFEQRMKRVIRMLQGILNNKPDIILRLQCLYKLEEVYAWFSSSSKLRLKILRKLERILLNANIPSNRLPIQLTHWKTNIPLSMADCYFELKQYSKALKYHMSIKGEYKHYSKIANIYLAKRNPDKAFLYWAKGISKLKETSYYNYLHNISNALNRCMETYYNKSHQYKKSGMLYKDWNKT